MHKYIYIYFTFYVLFTPRQNVTSWEYKLKWKTITIWWHWLTQCLNTAYTIHHNQTSSKGFENTGQFYFTFTMHCCVLYINLQQLLQAILKKLFIPLLPYITGLDISPMAPEPPQPGPQSARLLNKLSPPKSKAKLSAAFLSKCVISRGPSFSVNSGRWHNIHPTYSRPHVLTENTQQFRLSTSARFFYSLVLYLLTLRRKQKLSCILHR